MEENIKNKHKIKYLRWGIVFLLMLGMVNSYFDRMNMSFAASSIRREFGRWIKVFQWIVPGDPVTEKSAVAIQDGHAVIGGTYRNAEKKEEQLVWFVHGQDTVWSLQNSFAPGHVDENSHVTASAVSIDGDYCAVGAMDKTQGGRVYLFKLDRDKPEGSQAVWQLDKILKPEAADNSQTFGSSLSLNNNRLIVGAPDEGIVRVYENNTSGWHETAQIELEETENENGIGFSVSLYNQNILVGVPGAAENSGKVIFYTYEDEQWNKKQVLQTDESRASGARFGEALSLNDTYLLIGAPMHLEGSGSVFIYRQEAGSWKLHGKLAFSDTLDLKHFGSDIAFKENEAIIAAQQNNEFGNSIALVFHYEGHRWQYLANLVLPGDIKKMECDFTNSDTQYAMLSGHSAEFGQNISFIYQFLSMDPAKMGLILAMFFWAYGLMQVPAGRLVDKFGIRKLYTSSFFIWAFVATSFGLANSIWLFIVLRGLLGVLESVSAPASMAFIGRYFSENERGLATGIYLAGTKLGPSLGGIVAAWLIGSYGWRMLFILCGLVPLIWLLPWEYYYRKLEKRLGKKNVSVKEAKLTNSNPNESTKLVPLKTLFRFKKTWGVFWGSAAYSYTLVLYLSWLPTYFREHLHFSLARMGTFSSIAFGGVAVMVPLAGAMADLLIRRGLDSTKVRKGFINAGFFMGALIIPVPFIQSPDYALTVLLIAIVSMGMATANTWSIMQAIAPHNTTGTLAGVQNLGGSVGAAIAPLLTGFIVSASGTFKLAFIMAGLIMLSGIFSYTFLIGKVEQLEIN